MKKTKRNPQDTTLRNNRAHAKRLDKLEAAVKELQEVIARLVAASQG